MGIIEELLLPREEVVSFAGRGHTFTRRLSRIRFPQSEDGIMGKGNNSQGKEKKKPKKDAKTAPAKPATPPKK